MSGSRRSGRQPRNRGRSPESEGIRRKQSGLNKDEFLQLLVGQLKNQNPLSPVGSQEFMSQMAAFSTLEQVTNLAVSNEELNGMISTNQSLSLVGHTGHLREGRRDQSRRHGRIGRLRRRRCLPDDRRRERHLAGAVSQVK